MAKFDYKKWVTENKYGSLNEQQTSEPGTTYLLRTCNGSNNISQCLPDSFFGGSPVSVGHTFKIGFPPHPNGGGIRAVYVRGVEGACAWYDPGSAQYPINTPSSALIDPGPLASCPNNPDMPVPVDPDPVDPDPVDPDTGEEEGSFGTGGNYTVFDYPPAFDVTQWTANFIVMIIEHPNPCNFLTQRITQFNNQLIAGVGPLQANQLMQKIAVCQELFQMVGCGNLEEQVKRYRLDPKAAAVIRKMAPKLKGLALKGRRVKKESKKMSTLKTIIKEALSKLKETKSNKN